MWPLLGTMSKEPYCSIGSHNIIRTTTWTTYRTKTNNTALFSSHVSVPHRDEFPTYELSSKLLVSRLITRIVLPFTNPREGLSAIAHIHGSKILGSYTRQVTQTMKYSQTSIGFAGSIEKNLYTTIGDMS